MGEVYRARDTRLERTIAIKGALASDYFVPDLSKLGSATKFRTPHGEFGKAEGRTADPSATLPRISC
jgi:hypothetical protein